MNSIKCPDCGAQISRRSTHCPHCGCPTSVALSNDNSAFESGCGVIVVIIIAILAAIGYFSPKSDKESKTQKATSYQSQIKDDQSQNGDCGTVIKSEQESEYSEPPFHDIEIEEMTTTTEDLVIESEETGINTTSDSKTQNIRSNSTEVSLSELSDSIKLLN